MVAEDKKVDITGAIITDDEFIQILHTIHKNDRPTVFNLLRKEAVLMYLNDLISANKEKEESTVIRAVDFLRWLFEQIKEASEKLEDNESDIKPLIFADLVVDVVKDRSVVAQYFDDLEERLEGHNKVLGTVLEGIKKLSKDGESAREDAGESPS